MEDQIKQAALGLISSASEVDGSKFLASYLYYSLSESLVSIGKLIVWRESKLSRAMFKQTKNKYMWFVLRKH
ncbi:Hypothetical predicted protein [Olea europaea subsp. europaea]|nr:Hypothetical predicted protein [Olea europaea subsp. europaea]